MTVDGLSRLTLGTAGFDELGAGCGGAAALATLQAGQITRRSAILLASAREEPVARTALDVLARAQSASTPAVATALRHPFLGVWDARTRDPSYLTGMAAAAAVRAGVQATLEMRVSAGRIALPGMGLLRLPDSDGVAVLHCSDRLLSVRQGRLRITLDPDGRDRPAQWWPLRSVGPAGTALQIDDLDELRGCFGMPPADRLDAAEFRRVRGLARAALALLSRRFPGEASGLDAMVTALVPLRAPSGEHASASSRRASGAIALHFPDDARVVALLLLHEFQHVKLGALLDLLELVRPGGRARHRVGWRPDPRSAAAVLQGAYAHLAVARFWRHDPGRDAADRCGRAGGQVRAAIRVLTGSGELTPLGQRFVERMSEALRTTTGF